MITVKLYGLLRIESGIRERQVEAASVREVLQDLLMQGIPQKDLNGCIILINGKPGNRRSLVHNGDVVVLMSPVAGG